MGSVDAWNQPYFYQSPQDSFLDSLDSNFPPQNILSDLTVTFLPRIYCPILWSVTFLPRIHCPIPWSITFLPRIYCQIPWTVTFLPKIHRPISWSIIFLPRIYCPLLLLPSQTQVKEIFSSLLPQTAQVKVLYYTISPHKLGWQCLNILDFTTNWGETTLQHSISSNGPLPPWVEKEKKPIRWSHNVFLVVTFTSVKWLYQGVGVINRRREIYIDKCNHVLQIFVFFFPPFFIFLF